MKKLLSLFFATFTLSSCAPAAEPVQSALSAAEVLQKSAAVAQQVTALRLSVTGQFTVLNDPLLQGVGLVNAEGAIFNHGEQVQLDLGVRLEAPSGAPEDEPQFSLSLLSLPQSELYLRLHSYKNVADLLPVSTVVLDQFVDQWWRLPPSGLEADQPGLTPSPHLLRAQTEVVRITEDHGLTQLDGTNVYHMNVAIDPQKLTAYLQATGGSGVVLDDVAATGSLWIDASSFHLLRARWQLPNLRLPQQKQANVEFTIDLSDFNNVAPMTPPQNAIDFTPGSWFSVPQQPLDSFELPPLQEEQLLDSLLEESPSL